MQIGDQVAVYRNLNKPGLFSIKALSGPNKGKVVGYAASVQLANVTFKVSEASRQRVLSKRQREVHAWAIGTLTAYGDAQDVSGMHAVTYQPYVSETFFYRHDGAPIKAAPMCILQGADAFVN